jgi:histidinol-phosphate aminotransferase
LDALAGWAREHPATLFVVDEAYLSFAPRCHSALELGLDNILVLRSMTKDYALAGLRLGYASGPESVVSALARVRPPWNANALAQAAGVAALNGEEHLRRSLNRLFRARERLVAGLEAIGLAVLPSEVHFFLVEVGDAAGTRAGLLQQGVLVRDCTSFGLPSYLRVAARRPEENARLLAAWRSLLRTQGGEV